MEHVLQFTAPDLLPSPMHIGASSEVSGDNLVTITQKELWRLKREGAYWKDQYRRSCEREAHLKKELELKEALIRDLKNRLFGKKSEAGRARLESEQIIPAPKRHRGHQRGKPGHGRIERPDLPVIEECLELSGESCCCPECGLPYAPFPGDEESDIVEIEVSAYRRRICRKRYRKVCSCPSGVNNPTIIVAPAATESHPEKSLWGFGLGGDLVGQVSVCPTLASYPARVRRPRFALGSGDDDWRSPKDPFTVLTVAKSIV